MFLASQDYYKLTMGNAIRQLFPTTTTLWKFKNRTPGVTFTPEMRTEIVEKIREYTQVPITEEELKFINDIPYLGSSYSEYLANKRNPAAGVLIYIPLGGDEIGFEGPWELATFLEIPILSIINEVYFKHTTNTEMCESNGMVRLWENIDLVKSQTDDTFKFTDFGTRRRYSLSWHETVIKVLKDSLPNNFMGTSNPYFAMKYNLRPIGTCAHEWFCTAQGLPFVNPIDSQKIMLQKWVDVYRGDLGYALSDTLGFNKFLHDFDSYFAKLYDGVRHDSGDPFDWAARMIEHYKKLGIDPRTKQLIFSDGLDFPKAIELWKTFRHDAKLSFGIGTKLTNDIPGVTPLQIVMKVIEANGRPVAKISDSPGKTMCEAPWYIEYLTNMIAKELA